MIAAADCDNWVGLIIAGLGVLYHVIVLISPGKF